MKISVLTVFPGIFDSVRNEPVIRRALEQNLAELEIVDIKKFAGGSFRHIDDSPFGGGAGMVLRPGPVLDALDAVRGPNSYVAALTPSGRKYDQKTAHRFAACSHLILIAGHYEGFDERIFRHVDALISIGDYILTGGELPAIVVMDSVVRLLPGVLRAESTKEESFENGLLEYPQYTQPADFRGDKVPDVLLSGNHEAIRKWREEESLRITRERRPDLLNNKQSESRNSVF